MGEKETQARDDPEVSAKRRDKDQEPSATVPERQLTQEEAELEALARRRRKRRRRKRRKRRRRTRTSRLPHHRLLPAQVTAAIVPALAIQEVRAPRHRLALMKTRRTSRRR